MGQTAVVLDEAINDLLARTLLPPGLNIFGLRQEVQNFADSLWLNVSQLPGTGKCPAPEIATSLCTNLAAFGAKPHPKATFKQIPAAAAICLGISKGTQHGIVSAFADVTGCQLLPSSDWLKVTCNYRDGAGDIRPLSQKFRWIMLIVPTPGTLDLTIWVVSQGESSRVARIELSMEEKSVEGKS